MLHVLPVAQHAANVLHTSLVVQHAVNVLHVPLVAQHAANVLHAPLMFQYAVNVLYASLEAQYAANVFLHHSHLPSIICFYVSYILDRSSQIKPIYVPSRHIPDSEIFKEGVWSDIRVLMTLMVGLPYSTAIFCKAWKVPTS